MSPIPTFFSTRHEQHAPTTEYLHGERVPFFEMPQRIVNLHAALTEAGLVAIQPEPELISKAELAKTHDRGMIDYFEHLSRNIETMIREDFGIYDMAHLATAGHYYYESVFPIVRTAVAAEKGRKFYIYDSTSPVGRGTWDAIQMSASLAYAGAQALLSGERRAYAMCRPPGHHAGSDFAMGYCYFNNAAVAANALLARGRVALLDIDYHHGNGTQAIFWNQPDVFYVSIHVDPQVDYPYIAGFAAETGSDGATGSNLNIPLPYGTDSGMYNAALEQALEAIQQFSPATLVVSSGFDTYKDDPMAKFRLEVDDFRQIGKAIAGLRLPTLYVQEGGYNVEQLGAMAVAFFGGVLES